MAQAVIDALVQAGTVETGGARHAARSADRQRQHAQAIGAGHGAGADHGGAAAAQEAAERNWQDGEGGALPGHVGARITQPAGSPLRCADVQPGAGRIGGKRQHRGIQHDAVDAAHAAVQHRRTGRHKRA